LRIRDSLNYILADKNFQLLEDKLNQDTMFHILNIQKREVSHSAFVAWLLNPVASHGMNHRPLKSLLNHVCGLTMRTLDNHLFENHNFIDIIALDKIDFNAVQVEAEFVLDNKRRIDILVSVTEENDVKIPILIIEYKVEAKETNNQTVDYARWAKKQPKYMEKYEPIHLYIVPDNDDNSTPAEPFIIMDYDNFEHWLSHLSNYEKTTQAEFIINEFRNCLKKQQYMFDKNITNRVEELKEMYKNEIKALTEIKFNELDSDIKYSLRIHQAALEKLDIYIGSKTSKGVSEFIKFFKVNLQSRISNEQWKFNSKSGCITAFNIAFEKELMSIDSELGKKIYLQYWMERPSKQKGLLKVEIAGGGLEHKDIRLKLANSLKRYLDKDNEIVIGKEEVGIIVSLKINLPGVNDLQDDNIENVNKYNREIIAAINKFVKYFDEDKINYWIENDIKMVVDEYKTEKLIALAATRSYRESRSES